MQQLAFDFDARPPRRGRAKSIAKPTADADAERLRIEAYRAKQRARELAEAREYLSVGMVTSLPLWAKVDGSSQTYTQMLPGVVETIANDKASVRIYASPEYGCWLENYPIHKHLAVDIPLVDLGKFALNSGLVHVVSAGLLETGDAELAARIRAEHKKGRAP